MTRNEAKDSILPLGMTMKSLIVESIIDKIYDDFEQELQIATSDKTCTGCIHEPKTEKDNYAEECGLCKRFYGDGFEKKRMVQTRSQDEDYPKY